MDLHRLAALQRYWRRSPPLQTMVQAWLGIEPQADPGPTVAMTREEEEAALAKFMANFAAAGGSVT